MKRLAYLLLTLMLFAACTHTSHEPRLVAADSLLLSRPDSALTLLRAMTFSSTADRMYHQLLLADACNKCYDTLPPDSILREVADFYDRHGSANEQLRAHYLLGCAYRDLGEAPQALQCYQDAIDRADTLAADCNYRLLMSVYGQMAEIFHKQNLPEDELETLQMSGQCALHLKDTLYYIRSIELKVKPYSLLEDTAKLIETIKTTQKMYKEIGRTDMAINELGILIDLYVQRNHLDSAHYLMQQFERDSKLFDDSGNIGEDRQIYYNIKGNYYLQSHQLDSAEIYLRKLLHFGYATDAYKGLLSVYRQRNGIDSITKYLQLYEDALDTENSNKRTETVGQMQAMYNYQRYQLIAEREEKVATQYKWMLISFAFLVSLLSILIAGGYRRNKQKRRLEIEKLHTAMIQSQAEYSKLREELNLLKVGTEQLKKKKEEEIIQLRSHIDGYKEKLLAMTANRDKADEQFMNVLQKFRLKARGTKGELLPSEKEWKELITLFKRNKPIEQVTVCKEHLLSVYELRACILLLSGFSNSEICMLLDSSSQRVNNIKSRINKKLFNDSSASTLLSNLKYLSVCE